MVNVEFADEGTDEGEWQGWLDTRPWPKIGPTVFAGRRVVVVAAHPDDEVLGVGGLLSRLAACGTELLMVWGTDGEASHPGSTAISADAMRQRRRAESAAALRILDVGPVECRYLGLPDSGLSRRVDDVRAALAELVTADDLVVAPWRDDGHPDHEAVGHAAAGVATRLLEYPVWMWHWARPLDPRVPWPRLHTVAIDRGSKSRAIEAFVSQIHPIGETAADAAVLPDAVLRHFRRAREWLFA